MSADHQDDQEDWRRLGQEEKDPQKMIALVQQLIAKFDEQHARKTSPPNQTPRTAPALHKPSLAPSPPTRFPVSESQMPSRRVAVYSLVLDTPLPLDLLESEI